MPNNQQTRKQASFFKESAPSGSAPLWKKVNEANKTSPSSSTDMKNTETNSSNSNNAQPKTEINIHKFLEKLHHKISESVNESESQILEKLSIDWDNNNSNQAEIRLLAKAITMSENPIYTSRGTKPDPVQTTLEKLGSIEEFLDFIFHHNLVIYSQISQLLEQNMRLTAEQKKNKATIKLLLSKYENLQKNNKKLIEDFDKIHKEVDFQVQLEAQKIRYQYEAQLQKVQIQAEKQLQKYREQQMMMKLPKSNCSEAETKATTVTTKSEAQQSQNLDNQIKQFHQSVKANNKTKYQDSFSSSVRKQQQKKISNFDRLLIPACKQQKKQMRSLRLPSPLLQ